MSTSVSSPADGAVLGKDGLAALVYVLLTRGFTVVGPTAGRCHRAGRAGFGRPIALRMGRGPRSRTVPAAVAGGRRGLRQRGPHTDPVYQGRRSGAFLVAVECTEPGGTCFCVSMGTGPAAGPGYDLVLTELVDD